MIIVFFSSWALMSYVYYSRFTLKDTNKHKKNIKNPFTINFIVSIRYKAMYVCIVVCTSQNVFSYNWRLLFLFFSFSFLHCTYLLICMYKISSKDTIAKNILIAWPWYFSLSYTLHTSLCCSCLSNNFLFSSFVVNKQHSTNAI